MLKEIIIKYFQSNGILDNLTWLDSVNIVREGNEIKIYFPHKYFSDWFFTHKKKIIEYAIKSHLKREAVTITYPESLNSSQNYYYNCEKVYKYTFNFLSSNEYKDKNFDNFYYNVNNDFEIKVLTKISENEPGKLYSPVLICGNSGVGKTHLLVATAKNMLSRCKKDILIIPSKKFNAMDIMYNNSFFSKYQAIMIDDIDELIPSINGQSYLIDLLDRCYENIQIILTYMGDTNSLNDLNHRLLSRIKSGLTLYIHNADIDVRLRFIKKLCTKHSVQLSNQQIILIAQNSSDIRDAHGLFIKVKAIIENNNSDISDIDLESIVQNKKTGIDIVYGYNKIINLIAEHFDISVDDILSDKRHSKLVIARQICMYLCRTRLGISYIEIGKIFGGKDHSTVIHSVNKIKDIINSDSEISSIVKKINTFLQDV